MIAWLIRFWMADLGLKVSHFCRVSGYCFREFYRWRSGEVIPNKQSCINIVDTFARIDGWSDNKREIARIQMAELRLLDLRFRRNQ
jgi:hypothetical protein